MLEGIWFVIKITFTSFGGGAATMPVIEQQSIKKKWTKHHEFEKIMIITNSVPGPSMIQAIFYVLYKQFGFFKAFLMIVIGFLPITLVFLGLFIGFEQLPGKYKYAVSFATLPVICALIISLAIRFYKTSATQSGALITILIAIASAAFCIWVPSPWNIPAFLIILALVIGFISSRRAVK